MISYDLHGKVAVIAGGAQGIGLAVAQRLQASGVTALLWDRDGDMAAASAASLRANPGGRAHGAAVDVTDAGAAPCVREGVPCFTFPLFLRWAG